MSVAATFTMRQLYKASVHFGRHTRRWNPKMEPYISGVRNNTHIMDLRQSVLMLHLRLEAIRNVSAGGGWVLLVDTKRQAADTIVETAQRTGQYFVKHLWLGGLLTTWKMTFKSMNYGGLAAITDWVGIAGRGTCAQGPLAYVGPAITSQGSTLGVYTLDADFRDHDDEDERERRRCLDGLEQARDLQAASPCTRVITVCYREAD